MMRRRLARMVALALALSLVTLPTVGAQAHEGAHPDESEYELVTGTRLDWASANAAARHLVAPGCRVAHLATITSADEQAVLSALMATSDENAWIGGFQPRGELSLDDGWRWSTGPRWVFTSWAGGEPNDTPFGAYIAGSEQNLETLQGDGTWNDAPGFEEKYYVVESEHCG